MSTAVKNTKKIKNSLPKWERNNWFDYINIVLLAGFAALILIPFWHCLVLAFSDGGDVSWNGITFFWPRIFSLDSFQNSCWLPKIPCCARSPAA